MHAERPGPRPSLCRNSKNSPPSIDQQAQEFYSHRESQGTFIFIYFQPTKAKHTPDEGQALSSYPGLHSQQQQEGIQGIQHPNAKAPRSRAVTSRTARLNAQGAEAKPKGNTLKVYSCPCQQNPR